jgi:hypothetical protein
LDNVKLLFAGSTGLLWIHRLVNYSTRHPAPLHIPPFPQRRHLGRNMEDHLQGAFRINQFDTPPKGFVQFLKDNKTKTTLFGNFFAF